MNFITDLTVWGSRVYISTSGMVSFFCCADKLTDYRNINYSYSKSTLLMNCAWIILFVFGFGVTPFASKLPSRLRNISCFLIATTLSIATQLRRITLPNKACCTITHELYYSYQVMAQFDISPYVMVVRPVVVWWIQMLFVYCVHLSMQAVIEKRHMGLTRYHLWTLSSVLHLTVIRCPLMLGLNLMTISYFTMTTNASIVTRVVLMTSSNEACWTIAYERYHSCWALVHFVMHCVSRPTHGAPRGLFLILRRIQAELQQTVIRIPPCPHMPTR